jgi:hypothetical protein
MNAKKMLKIALARGPQCHYCYDGPNPATYYDTAGRGLCDKHTYVTHDREQYQDADSIRDILAFLQEE